MKKIRKNKKGWIRIVEAFLAVLLLMSVLVSVYIKNTKKDTSEEIYRLEKRILEEIANDESLRKSVLEENETEILNFVRSRVPILLNVSVKICEVEDVCSLDNYDLYKKYEIYSSERIISATLEKYNPKIVKIFIWREK